MALCLDANFLSAHHLPLQKKKEQLKYTHSKTQREKSYTTLPPPQSVKKISALRSCNHNSVARGLKKSQNTVSKINISPDLPKVMSPIRIPLIPRKTPTSLESDLTSLFLRSRKQTPNSAYRSKNSRVFRALSQINKREESPEKENPNVATVDKEIEALIEDINPPTDRSKEKSEQKSRDIKSREAYSREKKKGETIEGSSEYSHSGVYSLQEAQRITERLKLQTKRKKEREAKYGLTPKSPSMKTSQKIERKKSESMQLRRAVTPKLAVFKQPLPRTRNQSAYSSARRSPDQLQKEQHLTRETVYLVLKKDKDEEEFILPEEAVVEIESVGRASPNKELSSRDSSPVLLQNKTLYDTLTEQKQIQLNNTNFKKLSDAVCAPPRMMIKDRIQDISAKTLFPLHRPVIGPQEKQASHVITELSSKLLNKLFRDGRSRPRKERKSKKWHLSRLRVSQSNPLIHAIIQRHSLKRAKSQPRDTARLNIVKAPRSMQFNKAEEEVVTFSRKNEEEWEE